MVERAEDKEILKTELEQALADCQRLLDENAQLKRRLAERADSSSPAPAEAPAPAIDNPQLSPRVRADSSPELKVSLFRSLFRGRADVYAVKWEGRNGRTGYSPAGIREWNQVTTAKQGRKGSVSYSKFFPVTEEVIREHLLGRQTIGIYPLLQDDSCWFVAVDFDKSAWQADAGAFSVACREAGVPAALERSQSGNGAHVWIFFAEPISAMLARKLATHLLTRTMERHYAMGLDSYDRLFPSQDTMPKGGFGNLIALPLQRGPREKGNSLFVDEQLLPYEDQWAFLSSLRRLAPDEVRALLRDAVPTGDAVNIRRSSSDDDETSDPWTLSPSGPPAPRAISEPLPMRVSISLGNQVYVEKKDLPPAFLDRLIRLAAFQNPEFYKAQAMRLSTFGKPRVIACAEDLSHHIALPRGSLRSGKSIRWSWFIAGI